MAMDRAEKLGLGAAIGGHGLLLGAMALGLFLSAEPLKKAESISVSLIGEIADVSTAPDAIQEESAPPAPAEAEPVEPTPTPKPVIRDVPPPPAKTAPRKVAVKQPPPKTTKSSPPRSPGFSKSFEDAVNAAGKAPGAGKAIGTPAAKTAAEVRRSVTALLGPQIQRRVEACSPTGIELNKIITTVTLSLDASGKLLSLNYGGQTGITDSNRPQADPLKQCILQAVRAASPYNNLDPEYHDVWKSHAMRIKARG